MLKDNIPDITLTTSDLQIGAVEIKNDSTDDRAKVQAASSTVDTTVALAVADGNLHTSLGAVGATADPDGVIHGQLRSIAENTDTLPTALGVAASAASLPIVLANDDAHLGSVGAAADVDGHIHGQLRYVGEALGVTTGSAISADGDATLQQYARSLFKEFLAHLGAVGAAADADGVLHGQLYYLNGKLDALATDMAKLEARIAQPNMLVAPSSIAIDTTTARVSGLTVGTTYMVYTSAPCFIEVGPDNVEAATTNTYIEPGDGFVWTPTADNTDDGIACIAAVAGGKVYVQACQA